MLTIEEAIYILASADTTLQTKLGGLNAGGKLVRYTANRLPETPVYPAVTYDLIDATHVESHSGPSGLAYSRIQLSVWAKKYGDGTAVATALRLCLAGGKRTIGDLELYGVLTEPERTAFEPDTQVYQRFLDIIAIHSEPKP